MTLNWLRKKLKSKGLKEDDRLKSFGNRVNFD